MTTSVGAGSSATSASAAAPRPALGDAAPPRGPGRPGRARPRTPRAAPASEHEDERDDDEPDVAGAHDRSLPGVAGRARNVSSSCAAARTSRAPRPARRGRSRAGAGCRASSAGAARPAVECPACRGLPRGDLRAQHDVAEQPCSGSSSSRPGRSSSIGKDSTSVGPGSSIHCTCSCCHGGLVDEHDAQLGLRVHPHLVQHEPGQRDELGARRPSTPDSLRTSMLIARLTVGDRRCDVGRRAGGRAARPAGCAGVAAAVGVDDLARPAGAGRRRGWSAGRRRRPRCRRGCPATTRSPRLRARRQVDLGDVAGDDHLGAEARAGSGTSSSARARCSAPRRG